MSSKTPTTPNDLFLDEMPELTPEQKSLALDDILAEFGSALQSPVTPEPKPKPSASTDCQEQETEPPAEAAAPSLVIDGYDFSHFLSDDFGASRDDAAPPVQAPPAAEPSQAPAEQPAAEARPQDTPTASEAAEPSLVIDGVDFSEFLSDVPAPEGPLPASAPRKPSQPREQQKRPAQKPSKSAPVPDESAPRPQIRRRKATPGGILLRIAAFAAVLATVVFLYTQVMQDRVSSASFDDVSRAVLDQLDLDEMQPADAQMIRRLYGFAPSEMDGCTLYYPSTNMGARELLLVKLSDLSQQKAVTAAITARRQTQMNSFEGYGIEQYDLLEHSVLEVQGNYILFVVHEKADAVRQAFLKAL